jgi:DNA-binding LacI/PurR family transcriptional regulator
MGIRRRYISSKSHRNRFRNGTGAVFNDREREQTARMPVSIREVAERAGVSRATVSKVLSGTREKISPGTRTRVQAAAADLGYLPNAVARSLRRRRTDIIGFYSGHGTANWLLSELQMNLERYRKDLLVHGTYRGRSVDDIYAELAGGKIDGLICIVLRDDPLVPRLAASLLPAVAIADPTPELPSVGVDDAMGSRLLAEYLASRGHRRVLYRLTPERRESARRRITAFLQTAKPLGIEVITPTPVPYPGPVSEEEIRLLTGPSDGRPTAIVCWNDEYAFQALHVAASLGLRVPEDIAVVGFGGDAYPVSEQGGYLTTVYAPWHLTVQTAVDLLMNVMAGKVPPAETLIPVRLIVGDTA